MADQWRHIFMGLTSYVDESQNDYEVTQRKDQVCNIIETDKFICFVCFVSKWIKKEPRNKSAPFNDIIAGRVALILELSK